jgi:hypothetical protein
MRLCIKNNDGPISKLNNCLAHTHTTCDIKFPDAWHICKRLSGFKNIQLSRIGTTPEVDRCKFSNFCKQLFRVTNRNACFSSGAVPESAKEITQELGYYHEFISAIVSKQVLVVAYRFETCRQSDSIHRDVIRDLQIMCGRAKELVVFVRGERCMGG